MSKCFAYVLLFDFVDFQNLVNELVTGKVRFPPAPLSDFLEKKSLYFTQGIGGCSCTRNCGMSCTRKFMNLIF